MFRSSCAARWHHLLATLSGNFQSRLLDRSKEVLNGPVHNSKLLPRAPHRPHKALRDMAYRSNARHKASSHYRLVHNSTHYCNPCQDISLSCLQGHKSNFVLGPYVDRARKGQHDTWQSRHEDILLFYCKFVHRKTVEVRVKMQGPIPSHTNI